MKLIYAAALAAALAAAILLGQLAASAVATQDEPPGPVAFELDASRGDVRVLIEIDSVRRASAVTVGWRSRPLGVGFGRPLDDTGYSEWRSDGEWVGPVEFQIDGVSPDKMVQVQVHQEIGDRTSPTAERAIRTLRPAPRQFVAELDGDSLRLSWFQPTTWSVLSYMIGWTEDHSGDSVSQSIPGDASSLDLPRAQFGDGAFSFWLESVGDDGRRSARSRMRFVLAGDSILGLRYAGGTGWCASDHSASSRWRVFGGRGPYESVVGDGRVAAQEIPGVWGWHLSCAEIRAFAGVGATREHQTVDLPLQVTDATGLSIATTLQVGLLASAPPFASGYFELYVGARDIFLGYGRAGPLRDIRWIPDETTGVGRIRRVGEDRWSYFVSSPPAPQNTSGILLPSMRGLQPDTEYDLQIGWVWKWDDAEERLRQEQEPGGAAIHWTKPQRIRTLAAPKPTATTTEVLVSVEWLSDGGSFLVWAQSEQWPGVIWGDTHNHVYPLRYGRVENQQIATSRFSELPPDTRFAIGVRRKLPLGFATAPVGIVEVRTPVAEQAEALGVGDPSDIQITLGIDQVTLRWTAHEYRYTFAYLVPAADVDDSAAPQQGFRGHRTGPNDEYRKIGGGQVELTFDGLPRGSAWTLYVNRGPRRPWRADEFEMWVPYMCMIRNVRLAALPPGSYRDLFLRAASAGPAVTVGRVPDWPSDGVPYIENCKLADSTGP